MKRIYKVSEVLEILKEDGWFLVRYDGSHRHFHHLVKRGTTTVNGKHSDDVTIWLLKNISRQSGIKF
jgi:predicted RNA binding protein YcfA (HicA-like mRNA interferase family)